MEKGVTSAKFLRNMVFSGLGKRNRLRMMAMVPIGLAIESRLDPEGTGELLLEKKCHQISF